ncbi:MAG: DDE-type integrase/transposase/recombinase, partial [Bdellovibrionales bacterium]|nr:DDE-type integrase/transposase/recombinase [Bdellovibrionales bacterium]
MIYRQLPRGKYKSHDPELKKAVKCSGNISLATKRGVSRTTALYWVNEAKTTSQTVSCEIALLNEEIKNLTKELKIEQTKTQFISSLAKHLFAIRDSKRKVPRSTKNFILNQIEKFKKHCSLNELLSLIQLNSSKYFRWKSELKKSDITKKLECGVKRLNQLTGDEVLQILKLSSSKKYYHFSLSALWKYALRSNVVVCSKDTWFKYVKMFEVKRARPLKNRLTYTLGVRAHQPNEIWHIDVTEIKLLDGTKAYLQAIIDNFSRYVVDWRVNTTKVAQNTIELLKGAKNKIQTQLYMDQGGENISNSVNKLLIGKQIQKVLAKVDVKFSNSIIEAFFRSIKNNFLYSKSFTTILELRRSISFYIREHNKKMPHSTFKFETPFEIYFNKWNIDKDKEIEQIKTEAM